MSFILVLLHSFTLQAQMDPSGGDCFQRHMKEAIEINNERRGNYAKSAREQIGLRASISSLWISQNLIAMERLLLIPARKYDIKASKYHAYNIHILCDDLVEMSETPGFKEVVTDYPGPKLELNLERLKSELKIALKKKDFEGAKKGLYREMEILNSDKFQFCLTRHFLESMLRTLNLSPAYLRAYEKVSDKISSPKDLIIDYLNLHLTGFKWMEKIDRRAYDLQLEGIPIVCRDVPPIEYKI